MRGDKRFQWLSVIDHSSKNRHHWQVNATYIMFIRLRNSVESIGITLTKQSKCLVVSVYMVNLYDSFRSLWFIVRLHLHTYRDMYGNLPARPPVCIDMMHICACSHIQCERTYIQIRTRACAYVTRVYLRPDTHPCVSIIRLPPCWHHGSNDQNNYVYK